MTQRHDLDARLALYGDLSGILNAMRSFALAELRRVTQREETQHQTAAALAQALADIALALPTPESPKQDIWILLGSVRGFCASFNEDVLNVWQQKKIAAAATIVVGERLATLMLNSASATIVPGAISAIDAIATIDRILAAVEAVRQTRRDNTGLVICYRDELGARQQRLMPLPNPQHASPRELPITNEPVARVAAGVAEHYIFHTLLSILFRSLRVENHMRMMQMENALQHIERNTEDLSRLRNQLRQEEIVEEIELIIGMNSINGKDEKTIRN